MSALPKTLPVYDQLLDFLVEKATPEEILAFKAPDDFQALADELTEKNKAGTLTKAERDLLEQMIEYHLLFTELKARAILALKRS